MKAINLRKSGASVLLAALVLVSGCLLGPDEKKEQKKNSTTPQCKPLTAKENVIYNLVVAYKTHNIGCYVELLHSQYMWRNQDQDVIRYRLPEFFDRSTDSSMTANMFLAADHKCPDTTKYVDKLELVIEDGSWTPLATFQGNPCEDCWETTREYFITVIMHKGDLTLYANDLVRFAIVPETVNGQKLYRLGRADDIQKPLP